MKAIFEDIWNFTSFSNIEFIKNGQTFEKKLSIFPHFRSGATSTTTNVKDVYDLWRARRNFKNKHIFRVGKKSDIWRLN